MSKRRKESFKKERIRKKVDQPKKPLGKKLRFQNEKTLTLPNCPSLEKKALKGTLLRRCQNPSW